MKSRPTLIRNCLRAAVLALPAIAVADTTFQPRFTSNYRGPAGGGECTIRVMIDDEANVILRGDTVYVQVVSGGPARDDGSECTGPLPRNVTGFQFRGIDGRGEVRLIEQPSQSNRWSGVVNIRDKKGGSEGYTYRLSWTGGTDRNTDRFDDFDNRGRDPFDRGPRRNNRRADRFDEEGWGNSPGFRGNNNNNRRVPDWLTFSSGGQGVYRAGSNWNRQLRAARVDFRPNGDIFVELTGDETLRYYARWDGQARDVVEAALRPMNGYMNANGTLRLYTRDRRVERIEIQGDEGGNRGRRFDVSFTVR